ncbi:hypothetical protein [Streptomyces phaeochromogenes]|uniref:hypothetical protein n=1 Tax=Streptomyces phaeochromogenes TaxID=1923 RepID=UPI002DDC61AA|nr:hypothetical protein [Streptomyces phaeochromogenes]WRZ32310.1 hypothetical protein OG931_33540 [Streptomyces phaeochromogenes]
MPKRSCITCKSPEEEHRFLESQETASLKKLTGKKNVDGFMVCEALLPDGEKRCRNLRTYWDKKPFKEPLRLPDPT